MSVSVPGVFVASDSTPGVIGERFVAPADGYRPVFGNKEVEGVRALSAEVARGVSVSVVI